MTTSVSPDTTAIQPRRGRPLNNHLGRRTGKSRSVVLTPGEIKASLDVAGGSARSAELADPSGWIDLKAQPDRTVATVRRRLLSGSSPAAAQVFPWPKDREGRRPMAWLDPFDQIVYRGMVGRHVGPVAASIDSDVVLSGRLEKYPPRWRVQRWQDAIKERRERANELFASFGVLGVIDIQDYFPSVSREAVLGVIGRLPVHSPSFGHLVDWLDVLHATSCVTGLPIGPDGSQILGNGLLVPGDRALAEIGVSFLRYMDDTWVFLRHESHFASVLATYKSAVSVPPMGLVCHPVKSKVLDPLAALETIQRSAIQYAEADLDDPDQDALDTGLALFEHAMEDPDNRCPELRSALTILKEHRAPAAFEALAADVTLLALAPSHWRTYVRTLLADHKAAKKTDVRDWLVDQVTHQLTQRDAYTALVLLQAASPVLRPSKAEGSLVLDAAQRAEQWAEPIQVGAVHLWGNSQAFKPHDAVEAAEAAPTLAVRRAYALTLDARRDNKRMTTWVDALRRADPDLDATAAWLEAA